MDIREKALQEIEGLKKKTTNKRSISQQVASLDGWLSREERRITQKEEELEAGKAALEKQKANFNQEKEKLKALKDKLLSEKEQEDANKETNQDGNAGKDVNSTAALMDKELELRRQVASKKDDTNATISGKHLQDLSKDAETIRANLAKRRKQSQSTNQESTADAIMSS